MLCEYMSQKLANSIYQKLVENSIFNKFTVNLYQIISNSKNWMIISIT